jgi:hypothetical protein
MFKSELRKPIPALAVKFGNVTGSGRDSKRFSDYCCYAATIHHNCASLLDSLSLSRLGKSSGELSSVMILNPMFGNSL